MVAKKDETDSGNKQASTEELYATSKKKIITPINVTNPEEPKETSAKSSDQLKSPAQKKVIKPLEPAATDIKPATTKEPVPEDKSQTSEVTPNKNDASKSNDEDLAAISADEDPQSTTVEVDEAEPSAPEFVDEGQYHISVSKSAGKTNGSSSFVKSFAVFILIVALVLLAAYLYLDFFDIDVNYQRAYERIQNLFEQFLR